jgi:AcrR family transcriptional regulator
MASRILGRGDPARTLRLLWGVPPAPGRSAPGPKPSLSVDRIVETALALAEGSDEPGLSLRRLASRLGCTPMAIYTYVGGKEELLDLMYDRAHAGLAEPPEGPWAERVVAWNEQLLERYVRHPWAAAVSSARPVLGPHEQAALESLLRALRPARLTPEDSLAVVFASFALARSTARTIVEARRADRDAGDDLSWWRQRSRALEGAVPDFGARFPVTAEVFAAGGAPLPGSGPVIERAARARFAHSLRLLLQGATPHADPPPDGRHRLRSADRRGRIGSRRQAGGQSGASGFEAP